MNLQTETRVLNLEEYLQDITTLYNTFKPEHFNNAKLHMPNKDVDMPSYIIIDGTGEKFLELVYHTITTTDISMVWHSNEGDLEDELSLNAAKEDSIEVARQLINYMSAHHADVMFGE